MVSSLKIYYVFYLKPESGGCMELTINKQRILKAIQELPEGATIQDAQYRLYVLEQVSKSLASSGERVSQKEVEKEFLQSSITFVGSDSTPGPASRQLDQPFGLHEYE